MDEFFESVIDPIAILKQADGLTTIIADVSPSTLSPSDGVARHQKPIGQARIYNEDCEIIAGA